MKERPILFSGAMVRAILDGRKTQTRRLVKPQRDRDGFKFGPEYVANEFQYGENNFCCPYGGPGDLLWVKETFRLFDSHSECACYDDCRCSRFNGNPIYRADQEGVVEGVKWKPSIFMLRKFSRITLEIVSVRVERLQDITEEDAKVDGIESFRDECLSLSDFDESMTNVQLYKVIWESIHGTGSWGLNPWVWVIEFKEVKP